MASLRDSSAQENQTKLSHGLLLGELMTVVAAASEVRGKNLAGPVMFPTNAGSLDCVRLSPHFARDDNFSVNQHSGERRVFWQLRGCGNEGLSSLKGLAVVTRQTPDLRPGLSYGVAARLGRNAASRFAVKFCSSGDVSRRTRGPSTAFGFRLTSLGMTFFALSTQRSAPSGRHSAVGSQQSAVNSYSWRSVFSQSLALAILG
jgi:hypothetical protein